MSATDFERRCEDLGYIMWPKRTFWALRGLCAEFGLTMRLLHGGTEVAEIQDANANCVIIYVHTTSKTKNKSLRVRTLGGTVAWSLVPAVLLMLDELGIKMKNEPEFRRAVA